MLGIESSAVALAYLVCIASSLLCIGYGLARWNKGDEPVGEADRRWAAHEQQEESEEE